MKITYIKMLKKKKRDESMLMRHLRDENIKKAMNEKEEQKSKGGIEIIKNIMKNDKIKGVFSRSMVKKNQAVLIATSLMLVTAGYLNYSNNIKMAEIGDARLVSANLANSDDIENLFENEEIIETSTSNEKNTIQEIEQNAETDEEVNEEIVETVTKNNNEYFTKTKLERETMYSQMIESYQKILEKDSIDNEQKTVATNEIKSINERKNAIATIENLIKIKGIEDVVILINGNSVNVVVKSKENPENSRIAQIQNIVSRELNADIEDIHIATHE